MSKFPSKPQPKPPPKEPPKYRFRTSVYVGIPLTVGLFLWLLSGIEPSFHFADILHALDVHYHNRYVRLACLGIVLITVLSILKLNSKP